MRDDVSPPGGWAGCEARLAELDLGADVLKRGRATLVEMEAGGMPAPYLYEFDGDLVIEWGGTSAPTVTVTADATQVAILFPDYPTLAAYIKGAP